MMRKTILMLSLIPGLAFAITQAEIDAVVQANAKMLEKKGLPTPGSGIQVVPSSEINIDDSQKKINADRKMAIAKRGYVSETSNRAYELLHIEEQIQKTRDVEAKMFKATDSHLRFDISELPIAYTYLGVPKDAMKKFLGAAPAGSYLEEKPVGWTGAVMFFQTDFGNCAYTENNMILQGSAGKLSEDTVTYDVNGKVTMTNFAGNDSSGYLYHIHWFDSAFNHNLECATQKFSEQHKESTIDLAKKIDTYNSSK